MWKTFSSNGYDTKIAVVDKDAIVEAVSLKQKVCNPTLLDPSNSHKVGEGYKWGVLAMEEGVCRRSGFAYEIDLAHEKVKNFYSLKESELLYNPSVPIYKAWKRSKVRLYGKVRKYLCDYLSCS